MDSPYNRLATLIADLIQSTPAELILELIECLERLDKSQSQNGRVEVLTSVHIPQSKVRIERIIECWQSDFRELSLSALALSIRSALAIHHKEHQSTVELVWTGPYTRGQFRRTDQALLQLINSSRKRLLIVSFAVYKVQNIINALGDAIKRGVEITICLEDQEESQGKISFSGIDVFHDNVFRLANFYYWPIGNRPVDEIGRYGSLHSKLAVADREAIFISSANLTEYALNLNMEMGVLINDPSLASQVDDLYVEMVVRGILEKVIGRKQDNR